MISIRTLEIAGWASVLSALRLPFGKDCRSDVNAQWSEDYTTEIPTIGTNTKISINEKDLKLMSALVKRGDSHSKCLRGLVVYMEIIAPVYWWCEAECYRAGHERLSSQSTMHVDCKGLSGYELVKAKSEIPMGKMLKKIDMFSYQCLRNIVKQRHDHRLPEWREFINALHALPFAEELIFVGLNNNNDGKETNT